MIDNGREKAAGLNGGNLYNKYESVNPVARVLMRSFMGALDDLVDRIVGDIEGIIDAGCGEGYISTRIATSTGLSVAAFDASLEAIEAAQLHNSHPLVTYSVTDIDAAAVVMQPVGLVLCLEVLEHLKEPETALDCLAALSSNFIIVSVPREPLWRLLNLARGAYLSSMGNTPGHMQHWSTTAFVNLVSRRFDVLAVRTPLPWTMLLCRKKPAT